MKHSIFLFIVLICNDSLKAQSKCLEQSKNFFAWLEKNKKNFAECKLQEQSGNIELCDGTQVPLEETQKLFSLAPGKLLSGIQAKGLKVEILCDGVSNKGPFKKHCQEKSDRKIFSKVTSLHGMYLPGESVILLRSSSSPGSLIHEYLHHLQYINTNKIYGRVYKKSRKRIQNCLTEIMDKEILAFQALESSGQKTKIQAPLERFMAAQQMMMDFSLWQDMIDERSLFVFYLRYGKNLGIDQEDLELARLNMQNICKREGIQGQINSKHCSL